MVKAKKIRLDAWLLQHGLAISLAEAQALILSGQVFLGTKAVTKAGENVAEDAQIFLKKKKPHPWVSRGGVKLAHALEAFSYSPKDAIAADIGSSTGGFTDVLLHHDAAKVYAVDVGYGELAWKLQSDLRVVVLERTNARDLTTEQISQPLDLIVTDVSFTRLSHVLPAVFALTQPAATLIALIKPQFEVKKHEVGEGGIVRDAALHQRVCVEVQEWLEQSGWSVQHLTESPILGTEGNKEFLVMARKK